MRTLALQLLSGLSFGAILFMLASGLSLIMGVMGTMNMAHGAIYMVGAYIGWSVSVEAGLGYGLAAVAAAVWAPSPAMAWNGSSSAGWRAGPAIRS